MKYIAYGTSKLLKLYLENTDKSIFEYSIDNFTTETMIYDLNIFKDDILFKENKDDVIVVVFAVANTTLIKIEKRLIEQGFTRFKNFIYYSDFLIDRFNDKLNDRGFQRVSKENQILATELNRNLTIPVHTTILGNALLLQLIDLTKGMKGSIAEIGAFRCGASNINMVKLLANNDDREYYIFDSFEGFPALSYNDPQSCKKGDYDVNMSYEMIENEFLMNNKFRVIKGFVPNTFSEVDKDKKFSIVFYDCDLYEPALETFKFFEDKIEEGGFLIIHDYNAEKGGFEGVKKATDEYFKYKKEIYSFFENTMAVVKY